MRDRVLVARLKPVVLLMNQIRQNAIDKKLGARNSNKKLKQLGADKAQALQ